MTRPTLPPDLRSVVVSGLARALVMAWQKQQAEQAPEHVAILPHDGQTAVHVESRA